MGAVAGPVAVVEDRVQLGPELAAFDRAFDVIKFCWHLRRDARLSAAMREGVTRKLGAKQAEFDRMVARHPATLAENARRAEMRRLEKERLDGIAARKREREERRKNAALRHLRRRWHARDVSRSA